MKTMPDMPPGCEIAAAADADGVTLSWPAYKSGAGSAAVFLLFWLGGWGLGLAAAVAVVASVRGPAVPYLYAGLAACAVGVAVATVPLRKLFRPPTPESVRLEPTALKYDPGRGPGEARSCAELPDGKVVPVTPAPAAEVGRAAIRGFAIDRVNGRERLYLDRDGRRVEIGGCLTTSERAWLFAVLQEWLGEARPAPAWSREARRGRQGATS